MVVTMSVFFSLLSCISVCVVIRYAEGVGILELKSNSPAAPVVATIRSRSERLRREASESRLTAAQRQEFLTAHNNYRRAVSPEAANMEELVWDEALASMAQEWADRCVWEHGQPERDPQPYQYIGQNNYATTGTATPSGATQAWYSEVADYNYDTNQCAPDKVCGHYTQVVWATSNHIGCGIANCPTLQNSRLGHGQFVVCDYGPAGNFIGRKPYIKGAFCSSCPQGTFCRSNLCAQCGIASCENGGSLNMESCQCSCPDGFSGETCGVVEGTGDNTEGGEGGDNEGGDSSEGANTTEGSDNEGDDNAEVVNTTEGNDNEGADGAEVVNTTEGNDNEGDDNAEVVNTTEGADSEGGDNTEVVNTTENYNATTEGDDDDNDGECFFFCARQAGYVASPVKWLYAVGCILVLSNILG